MALGCSPVFKIACGSDGFTGLRLKICRLLVFLILETFGQASVALCLRALTLKHLVTDRCEFQPLWGNAKFCNRSDGFSLDIPVFEIRSLV